MIKTICHLADIHIRKSPARHFEYREVFENLYESLKKEKPDRIVLVGDLYHDYIDLQPEATILACEFLNKLAEIAPVRITRGNHDIRKKSINRIDSIEAIVKSINNPNIIYYNEIGFFDDENVTWAVWKHGEKNNSPWNKRGKKPKAGNIVIDLFHDPINGAASPSDFEFNSKVYNSIKHFMGNYSLFGDIHLKQLIEPNRGYSGSLIEQNFAEGDGKFHGYLLWDIKTGNVKEVEIKNDYSYNSVIVNQFTDFDDLDIQLENPTKHNRVRVVWRCLPEVRNNDNERKVVKYLNDKFNVIFISHKNEFIEDDIVEDVVDFNINDIVNQTTQHEIFTNYLTKIGVEDNVIDDIIDLDNDITSRLESEDLTNIQWNILKIKGTNFMSYENLEVDWSDDDGLYQISGLNTAGKTTIMKLITYILYNKTLETESRVKFGDSRYVNNRNGADFCEGSLILEINSEYYGIKRRTTIEKNKQGEIKGAPTILNFYKLNSPDDEFTDDNNLNNLIEDDRIKTQKLIERGIGSYDNFMRVVMTTSDTLNNILSSEKSIFIDSLLNDSGLDIFDLKLNAFKAYDKDYMSKPRVNCDITSSELKIENLVQESVEIENLIKEIHAVKIPDVQSRIKKGEDYVDSLNKKLHRIDNDIYRLDIHQTQNQINIFNGQIKDFVERKERLEKSIVELVDSYDEDEYGRLLQIKEEFREADLNDKSLIKDLNSQIYNTERLIEQSNGFIYRSKQEGKKYKDEIAALKNDTNCPTCGQELGDEHKKHTNAKINEIETSMFDLAKKIRDEEDLIYNTLQVDIEKFKHQIEEITKRKDQRVIDIDETLHKIGEIQNQINDVNRRKEVMTEIDKIPPQIEILQLKIDNLNKCIHLYNQSLQQIEENQRIDDQIIKAKVRLGELKQEEQYIRDDEYNHKTRLGNILNEIKITKALIEEFQEQEKIDNIHRIYKKCIHRDGIPTQLLSNYIVPKINSELDALLKDIAFNVWLDEDDLKLKLGYNTVESAIDGISGSGKERTFASVALKFALNQINAKSKPTIFLLDEVMGKLTEDSVEEFVSLIQEIKKRMKKVLIVEHNHEINPDYTINVTKDENGISSLTIE